MNSNWSTAAAAAARIARVNAEIIVYESQDEIFQRMRGDAAGNYNVMSGLCHPDIYQLASAILPLPLHGKDRHRAPESATLRTKACSSHRALYLANVSRVTHVLEGRKRRQGGRLSRREAAPRRRLLESKTNQII